MLIYFTYKHVSVALFIVMFVIHNKQFSISVLLLPDEGNHFPHSSSASRWEQLLVGDAWNTWKLIEQFSISY